MQSLLSKYKQALVCVFRKLASLNQRRQRERHENIDLMSKTIVLHMCFKFWYVSFIAVISKTTIQREMTKKKRFCGKRRHTTVKFLFSFLSDLNGVLINLVPGNFAHIVQVELKCKRGKILLRSQEKLPRCFTSLGGKAKLSASCHIGRVVRRNETVICHVRFADLRGLWCGLVSRSGSSSNAADLYKDGGHFRAE